MRKETTRLVLGLAFILTSVLLSTGIFDDVHAALSSFGVGLVCGAGLWGLLTPSATEIRAEERKRPCPHCGRRQEPQSSRSRTRSAGAMARLNHGGCFGEPSKPEKETETMKIIVTGPDGTRKPIVAEWIRRRFGAAVEVEISTTPPPASAADLIVYAVHQLRHPEQQPPLPGPGVRAAIPAFFLGDPAGRDAVLTDQLEKPIRDFLAQQEPQPQVVRESVCFKQVCVPEGWSSEQIVQFAGPSGTSNGWTLCEDGNEGLGGSPARVPCEKRKGFVHVVLEA